MAQPRSRLQVNFGDIVSVDFGLPIGSEAGFLRPGVVLTADAFLRLRPSAVFVIPLTSTARGFPSHVEIGADATNSLETTSWALVEQLRAVSVERCGASGGNVGPSVTSQLLDIVSMIMGMR